MGEFVVGSNVLIPKPIASWPPLAKLVFRFKLFSRGIGRWFVGEPTFVVRKEAASIEDKRLIIVDIKPCICVPKVSMNKRRFHHSAVTLERPQEPRYDLFKQSTRQYIELLTRPFPFNL